MEPSQDEPLPSISTQASSPPEGRMDSVTRHSTYYFTYIVFKVDNVLYKVPGYRFLEESPIFRDMFSLPSGESVDVDGSSDEHPLELQGIDHVDFERLLDILYPLQTPIKTTRSLEELTSILKLSTMWSFRALRKLTIGSMDDLVKAVKDPIKKISLAHEYMVSQWLVDGFEMLVKRPESLSQEEWALLGSLCVGFTWCWVIMSEREKCFKEAHRGTSSYYNSARGQWVTGPGGQCGDSTHSTRLKDMLRSELDMMAMEDSGDA